ncbi:HAD-IIIC family phosphatase [Lichenifustis flavocetrariae]|uniref:HAD-IIIC family phosphatase n=1 Tax=Lichenifustis flavocetrariae TaxID=2949735 RepID=A0AA41YYG3_9HYPH|nr:HAD-IIIC family phosphatase [Lichenifustis flavocetrariae]MCW6509532.1 HAD-IIIC family phosphatase [Lichenifustis flavocetrariae]
MSSLDLLDWQQTIFAEKLSRYNLLKLEQSQARRSLRIHIYRNHGFEQVATALKLFLTYAQFDACLDIGEYDDSFQVTNVTSDLGIVWLDFDRYARLSDHELHMWIFDRLAALREATRAPFIVADLPTSDARARDLNAALSAWSAATPGTAILRVSSLASELSASFFDDRRSSLTGTRYSDAACLGAARELGLSLIPSLIAAPIKAVAVDLDNTLYQGVLAEDGPHGVVLTEAHHKLHTLLAELASKGVLLIVVSRNEADDVTELFRERGDFPIHADHIASWQVSWAGKADGISKAAAELQIATDAVLLLDDNLGELTSMARDLPDVKLLFAGHSPEDTVRSLRRFPSLWPSTETRTDLLRVADIQANKQRQAAAGESLDKNSYIRSLGVEIGFTSNPRDELQRFYDMSVKTNQFNIALLRPSAADISLYLDDPERRAVMIYLRDRLADSGSVGSLLVRRDHDCVVVEELCLSCRSLGRFLESVMITEALRYSMAEFNAKSVRFRYRVGPRNQPAITWLSSYTGSTCDAEHGTIEMAWDQTVADRLVNEAPVALQWRA